MNKEIKRDAGSVTIFDDRTLAHDYATLVPVLREGLQVLDVGCGTGAISKDIAKWIGATGSVTGIDNTERFIQSGLESYGTVPNLKLIHVDLFHFEPEEQFDLIVSARTLQWLSTPAAAVQRMKNWLKPGGILSVLDYNHTALEWQPAPPLSMQQFYNRLLKWRADAGMNNQIAEDLQLIFAEAGLTAIQILEANEIYVKSDANFKAKLGIWSKVAASTQMVEEGYLKDEDRLQTIEDYNNWIETDAQQMVMKLN